MHGSRRHELRFEALLRQIVRAARKRFAPFALLSSDVAVHIAEAVARSVRGGGCAELEDELAEPGLRVLVQEAALGEHLREVLRARSRDVARRDLDDVLLNNVLDECMNMNRNLLLLFDGAVDLRSFKLGGVWRLTDLTNDVSASIVRRPRAFCTAGLESRLSISPIRLPSILVE